MPYPSALFSRISMSCSDVTRVLLFDPGIHNSEASTKNISESGQKISGTSIFILV